MKGFKFIDIKALSKIKTETKHPLNHCGFTPLLVDAKYLNYKHHGKEVYTKEEKENFKKLISFESKGYKIKINGVPTAEELIIDVEDLK